MKLKKNTNANQRILRLNKIARMIPVGWKKLKFKPTGELKVHS